MLIKSTSELCGRYTPEFVLALGDNFYDDGVKGPDDPQFLSKFEDTFKAPSLQACELRSTGVVQLDIRGS